MPPKKEPRTASKTTHNSQASTNPSTAPSNSSPKPITGTLRKTPRTMVAMMCMTRTVVKNSTITKAIKSKQNNGRDEENVDPVECRHVFRTSCASCSALFYYLSEHHLQHAQESGQVSLLIDEPIISYPKTL